MKNILVSAISGAVAALAVTNFWWFVFAAWTAGAVYVFNKDDSPYKNCKTKVDKIYSLLSLYLIWPLAFIVAPKTFLPGVKFRSPITIEKDEKAEV